MDIGGHSRTHVDLTSVSIEKAQIEIKDCKTELEGLFKINITDFCYPYGRFDEVTCNLVKDSGYDCALTMQRGRVELGSDRFILPRIPVNYRTPFYLFLIKLLTRYEDGR